jgi:serine protease Do
VHGVVISAIDSTGTARSLGLARGDVVVSINQLAVHSPAEAAQQLKEIAKSPKKTALLLLNRHGVTQYVGVNLGKDQG